MGAVIGEGEGVDALVAAVLLLGRGPAVVLLIPAGVEQVHAAPRVTDDRLAALDAVGDAAVHFDGSAVFDLVALVGGDLHLGLAGAAAGAREHERRLALGRRGGLIVLG